MNVAYFIAKRLISTKDFKSSISAPIIKIAIAAIAIGMVMMLLSIATGFGLQEKIRDKIAAFNGHIIISNYDNNQSEATLNPILKPDFKDIQGISHIQGIATKAGLVRTETLFEGVLYKGVGKDYDWNLIQEYMQAGRVPNVLGKQENQEVVLSSFLAKRLNLKIGDGFNTFFISEHQNKLPKSRRFIIVGLFSSGFQEFDATYIIGDIRHVQRMNKWKPNQVGAFEVFVNRFEDIAQIGKQIYKQTPSNLDTKSIIEKHRFIFDWLQLFDFNIMVILIIMVLVATINMVVALLVLILERTQMIGVLKALGANNWTLRKLFLYNAVYLIFKGLLWGNIIGISLLLIQKYFGIVQLDPENYYVLQAPVYLDWKYIVLLNLYTLVVCGLVLLVPSYLITKISPVKALRFD